MNEGGFVWARSAHFTFCSPEPLDDLETVTEERDEEEGDRDEEEEEMLLVIPKAQLLKVGWAVSWVGRLVCLALRWSDLSMF